MLLFMMFWMFNGLCHTLLYYFWDYPINRRPSPKCCFLAYFSVSQKRNIKRSPNGMKPSGELFLERKQSRRLGVDIREASRKPRGREARPTPWARPHPRGPLVAPLTVSFRLYMSIYPKNNREHNRLGVPLPRASVATKKPIGTLFRHPAGGADPSPMAIFIIPALSMTSRE